MASKVPEKSEIYNTTTRISNGEDANGKSDVPRADLDGTLIQAEVYGQTQRGLKSRHIQLIALGGAIGTGLFVGSGTILSTVGPAPLFMSYVFMSMVIWCIMNSLAEMTVYIPQPGVSVPYYVNRFFEPSLAFAAGWNYWYTYAILIAAEISASATVIQYWISEERVSVAVWITILLVIIIVLNVFVVSIYGEAEFWFATIKLITLFGLIIVGIVIFFGRGPNHTRLGFYYWQNPGAFISYKAPGDTGKFLGFWYAFIHSGFAFITTPELVTITAGESESPRRNIPRAASRFIYRLAFFYCLGSLVITILVASNDPNLIQAVTSGVQNAGASPFVLGIQNAGIPVLNHIINAAIVTSAASAANSFLYAASRNLYSLSVTGQAPAIFQTCNKQGVPWVAVAASAALGCLAYLSVSNGSTVAFNWFLNLTTVSGFIAWVVVLITYLRFRKALMFNGAYDSRPYETRFQPYSSWIALIILIILSLTSGFQVFFPGSFTASTFLAAYVTIPAFLLLYFGHKIWLRGPWVRPISDVDIFTGKTEADELERLEPKRTPRNVWEKIWFSAV